MNGVKRILSSNGIGALTALVLAATIGLGASRVSADEPIVGLWLATWTDDSGGPNEGAVILQAWDVWHPDRTEAQNDSGPVSIGFVCQGVWVPLGGSTYFLTHPNFNYIGADGHLDPTSSGVTYEKVTVSKDHNSFEGTGLIKVFTGIDPFDPSATLIGSLPIKLTGKRVVADPSQLP